MSFRKDSDQSTERRIKRRMAKYKLDLLKPQRLNDKMRAHGGYKVREAMTGKILLGEQGYEFSASIEDIEAWLDAEEAKLYGTDE